LRVEPALQENLGGDLVDDTALIAGFASGFLEGALCGDSGEAFVPWDDGTGGVWCEIGDEGAGFFSGGAECAVHVARHADNDGLGFFFAGEGEDALANASGFDLDGFQRMSHHAEFIAECDAHAGFADIDSKCAFHLD